MGNNKMISIIIGEHNEAKEFVLKMISQVAQLPYKKELIFVTSSNFTEFYSKFGKMDNYKFPVSVIGGADSCGAGRNVGGYAASGDTLLYMDCHVCFTPSVVDRLLATQKVHPDAVVAPALQPVEFPLCKPSGGKGHGVVFRFVQNPFEWVWLPGETEAYEYTSPFVCGCAFMMKKDTFNVLNTHGGFLGMHKGLSWEEEATMRLWRLGHPTYVEPRATFGHLFKGYAGHPEWDEHSTSGYYVSRTIGVYVNVFDKDLWKKIDTLCSRVWRNEWTKNLQMAKSQYSWLRNLMKPLANKIDENWFLRT